jgi:hypothetical protein
VKTPLVNTELSDDERGTDMTWTYVRVIAIEALIFVALWYLGRVFS